MYQQTACRSTIARSRTRGDQVAAVAVAEVVEDAVAVALQHLGVDVEAGVAQLRDLLGQLLDAVDAVAEDDRLVDLQLRGPRHTRQFPLACGQTDSMYHRCTQGGSVRGTQGGQADLGEEGVQAVHLLLLLHERIVLQHTHEQSRRKEHGFA